LKHITEVKPAFETVLLTHCKRSPMLMIAPGAVYQQVQISCFQISMRYFINIGGVFLFCMV